MKWWFSILSTVLLCLAGSPLSSAGEKPFGEGVGAIFAARCLECHHDRVHKGGLSLQTSAAALAGGDSGDVILPGDPESSYLLELIVPSDGVAEMPKGGPPLGAQEITTIRRWIADGAEWPKDAVLEQPVWWSLRPLVRPAVPAGNRSGAEQLPLVSDAPPTFPIRTPVDSFVLEMLCRQGLSPSAQADRRTLIRRLYFDLIGLPPTPHEIDAFTSDPDAMAYERLVDRLLDSPRYGERWARHWLDVVHFGETHGYDKDKPRSNAWPYRDYVIRAWNEDKPYTQFVQEQLAGDVLFPGTRDGIEALGFIAAGPWDLIGHAEVPETKIDGKVARHLDRDDMVQNTMATFTSLTVGCAQCHDHKFDPITQEDYYSLQAVFAALDRADREYDVDADVARRRADLLARQRDLADRRQTQQERIGQLGGEELADLDRRIQAARKSTGKRPPEYGYHSGVEPAPDKVKWVQIDLGREVVIRRIEYAGCEDDFNGIGAGFGFPVRFKIEVSSDPQFGDEVTCVVDRTGADVPNPGTVPQVVPVENAAARYVRMTASKLAPRKNDYIFALSELRVFDREDRNVAEGKTVTSLDSIEAPVRWRRQNLVDGLYPGTGTSAEQLSELQQQRTRLLAKRVDASLRAEFQDLQEQAAAVEQELKQLPKPQLVYAGTVHHGSGNFRGTGPDGGRPRQIHVLHRGDVTRPGDEVGPGALSCLDHLPPRFEVAADAPEGERRAALARWLTDPRNPLLWRSIVNRVWLYHFGRGLVDTPNDFGRMGQPPTHPELLDYLAVEFRDGGQSLKALHRLIVNSSTYRQSSLAGSPDDISPAAAGGRQSLDPANRYYWRMNRRRLEAEAIRDSILFAAGKLDFTMGGPSFQDFVVKKPQHSPHYEYHLHDPDDPRSHRRSIYRFLVRSQTQPFMNVMDCADPSMLVAKRNQTITPLQALTLLNNQLTLAMAKHFAARVDAVEGDLRVKSAAAFQIALGRPPTDDELTELTRYAERHGLANTCRAIMNLSEFVFVD